MIAITLNPSQIQKQETAISQKSSQSQKTKSHLGIHPHLKIPNVFPMRYPGLPINFMMRTQKENTHRRKQYKKSHLTVSKKFPTVLYENSQQINRVLVRTRQYSTAV